MAKRIYYFDEQGKKTGYRLDGPRTTMADKLRQQRAWIEYKETCEALGLPVLWESPFAAKERSELAKRIRETRPIWEKRYRSPNKKT